MPSAFASPVVRWAASAVSPMTAIAPSRLEASLEDGSLGLGSVERRPGPRPHHPRPRADDPEGGVDGLAERRLHHRQERRPQPLLVQRDLVRPAHGLETDQLGEVCPREHAWTRFFFSWTFTGAATRV